MNSTLDTAAGYLAAQSLQVAFVFLLVLAACWLLREANSHWRYLLWLVVIAKCVTPPVVSLPLPVLPTTVAQSSAAPRQTAVLLTSASTASAEPIRVSKTDAPKIELGANARPAELYSEQSPTPSGAAPSIRFTPSQILTIAWALLAGALLAVLGGRIWATQRRLHRLRAIADVESRQAIAGLAETLGFKSAPRVYEIESTVQPFVWGWLWGDIYLPLGFSQSGSAEERRAILTHELAHVSRWDVAVNHVQNFVQTVFFFHPLVWWANRRLRQEREKCCDEMVLASSGASPRAYCNAIVDMLARECASRRATPGLAVTGSARNIQERISTMLTPNRLFLRRPSRTAVVTLLLFAAGVLPTAFVVTSQKSATLAGEQDAKAGEVPVEMKPFKLKLVDEAKNPIAGANVIAAGLRIEESPSSGCGWPTNVAPKNEFVTDQDGVVEIQYPVKFGGPGFWMTTTRLIFRVSHADFAGAELEVDAAPGYAEHGLMQGCRAVFRGVDSKGTPTSDFAVLLTAGRRSDPIWKRKPGEVSSGGLPVGKLQAMLVSPSADGLHRFSDLLTVDSQLTKESTFNDVELRPGIRIRGELSKNVPRPIKNGTVNVWCAPKPAGEVYSDEPSLGWGEETSIAEDGTFEFPSLPRGGRIQFVALCDGWVVEGMENGLVVGKEIVIDDKQLRANRVDGVILPMAAAGSVEVEVTDEDGKPLTGAMVVVSAHHWMKLYGTTILGNCYPTVRLMQSQIAGTPPPKGDWMKNTRYIQKTDESGKAILREIPIKPHQTLQVSHEHFATKAVLASGRDPFRDEIRFNLDSVNRKKLTIKMYRIKESSAAEANPAEVQETKLDVTMNKPESGFDVALLTTEAMLRVLNERKLTISPEAKKAILDYAEKLENAPEEVKKTVQSLRDGAETITLQNLAPLLQDKETRAISAILSEHPDPVMRFAATLFLASNGDANATQALHKLIHDKALSKTDRQVICSWSNGVGIRATDSPADISGHFANVTRTEPKFKKGDLAPDFELETVSGQKFASKDLRGKVIVLHFWGTSCGPCMGQMPSHIASLSKHDSEKVEIIFVSLDDEKDKFIEAVKQYKIPFKNVRDERGWGGELARLFGVRSLPFDVIIDREGKIAANSIEEIEGLIE